MHTNIFETKTDKELHVLYSQFLEAEKNSAFSEDTELGRIKKEYYVVDRCNQRLWTA